MQSRARFTVTVLLVIALIGLIAMLALRENVENSAPPPVTLTDDERSEAERIIRARINSLSPTPPTLGDRFEVGTIGWDARGRAFVTYGDGESTLEGTATVITGSGRVKVESFEMR